MKTAAYILILSLAACNKSAPKVEPRIDSATVEVTKETEKRAEIPADEAAASINQRLLSILKSKDYHEFSQYIHPQKGVRFSMYAYLHPENKIFSKEDFDRYINSNIKFTWGSRDGSGEPLVLSLKDYFEKWIFKRDFSNAEYHFNEFRGQGNSLNNIKEIYPTQNFTENYIPGTEKYGGMDWNSLRFVFEQYNGIYYLVAVINDEWTV